MFKTLLLGLLLLVCLAVVEVGQANAQSAYTTRAYMYVTAANVAAANSFAQSVGGGANFFSIQCSPTAQNPATYYAANTLLTSAQASAFWQSSLIELKYFCTNARNPVLQQCSDNTNAQASIGTVFRWINACNDAQLYQII